jgi:hypothetical protein
VPGIANVLELKLCHLFVVIYQLSERMF